MLKKIRETIRKAAPKASEAVHYGVPTFLLDGYLVHYGAYKSHIGFYPTPGAIVAFENELSKYERSKGAVKFPLKTPMPLSLISKIVKYRVKQNSIKVKSSKNKIINKRGDL